MDSEPSPEAQEQTLSVESQPKKPAGWGSMLSSITSTVSSNVIQVASGVSKIFDKPPLPEIDIDGLIGRFVMSEYGGTRFDGDIDKEFNECLPEMLTYGDVRVSLHERGVRIDQKKGYPLLIPQATTEEISLQKQPIKRRVGVAADLATSALDGAIGGGLIGASLAASKAALTGQAGTVETIILFYVRFVFVDEEAKKWELVVQADPACAELFKQRVEERGWTTAHARNGRNTSTLTTCAL